LSFAVFAEDNIFNGSDFLWKEELNLFQEKQVGEFSYQDLIERNYFDELKYEFKIFETGRFSAFVLFEEKDWQEKMIENLKLQFRFKVLEK
jgi:hypothetical protein